MGAEQQNKNTFLGRSWGASQCERAAHSTVWGWQLKKQNFHLLFSLVFGTSSPNRSEDTSTFQLLQREEDPVWFQAASLTRTPRSEAGDFSPFEEDQSSLTRSFVQLNFRSRRWPRMEEISHASPSEAGLWPLTRYSQDSPAWVSARASEPEFKLLGFASRCL